ncbi:MAG: AAA family ATPase [Ignavibacteriales bacterium]|nr:AAA family ATPase [Ignavibacteriales bacterium]
MKKRIKEIHIQNFKVFKEAESINFEGKNALIFGNNGSGKSSLYWALYTFLQSSIKTKPQVQKYFEKGNKESLLNIFEEKGSAGYIKLVTVDEKLKEDGYLISFKDINTDCSEIKESNLASDFLNYRLLLRFYYFRHSEPINLFPVFYKEFFPYWSDSKYGVYDDWYSQLKNGLPYVIVREQRRRAGKNYKVYKDYQKKIETFNSELDKKIIAITGLATKFYKEHFFKEDELEILLNFDQKIQFDAKSFKINSPSISLKLKYRGKDIERPQSFLNESRLTAIALSIKFAALKNRLQEADLKFLVLDDLLISLDMSNRMNIIQIILSEFSDYQIFILTHDKGLYEIIKNNLIKNESEWKCFEFYENNNSVQFNNPLIRDGKDYIEKAENYLTEHKLEESALCLRKKTEELIKIYYDPSLENLTRFYVLENLCNSLKRSTIKNERHSKRLSGFINLLETNSFDVTYLDELKKNKLAYDTALAKNDNDKNIAFKSVVDFIMDYKTNVSKYETELSDLVKIAEEVNELRDRILNIGAHHTTIPVFEQEIKDAIIKLKEFQKNILKLKNQ